MQSFVQTHYKVAYSQFQFVRDLTRGCNEDTYRFFCHVLVCSLLRLTSRKDDLFIPVAWTLRREKFKNANWKQLKEDLQLIENTDYSKYDHLSMTFKVKDWVLIEFIRLGEMSAEDFLAQQVDLFTGKQSTRIQKSDINDDNGHPVPELIRSAIKVFEQNKGRFDLKKIEEHLNDYKIQKQKTQGTAEFNKAQARLLVDEHCFREILKQNPVSSESNVYLYSPAYKASSTGRIHHKGGGLQSCTREMKNAAYANVQNVRNYDLSASQVNALIQFFEEAGLNSNWLTSYRDAERNKEVFAAQAGLSVETWKKCLLALIMGAHLPRKINDYENRSNSILRELADEARDDPEKLRQLLAGFTDVVTPLVEQLEKWHEWLLRVYLPTNKRNSPAGWFIVNKTGKKKYLSDLPDWSKPYGRNRWQAKSELAAFLLQGIEAATIHNLTLLGNEYGYEPIANEHDGLVVIGDIPDEAVQLAARSSGFLNARIVLKPFTEAA